MNTLLDALGVAGDVLSTPGSVVRGLLSGNASRAFGGILDPSQRVSGKELLSGYGIDGGDIGGFAADMATDPLTWTALGHAGRLAKGAAAAGELAAEGGGSALSKTLGLRRGFGMIGDLDEAGNFTKATGEIANPRATSSAIDSMNQTGGKWQGFFDPESKVGVVRDSASPTTARHEMIHGLINEAIENNKAGDLPSALMRLPAQMRQGAAFGAELSPTWDAASQVAEELAAHTLEHRGLLGQLGGAANFLIEHPGNAARRAAYAAHFGETSPLVGALYRGAGYAPYVGAGAAVGGAGALGGY